MAAPVPILASWLEVGNATDGTATATRAAPSAGVAHHVTSVAGSFDDSATATLILKDDGSEVARWNVDTSFHAQFASPIRMTPGNAISLELSTGGADTRGDVVLTGYSI